jgi:hypothetical protein
MTRIKNHRKFLLKIILLTICLFVTFGFKGVSYAKSQLRLSVNALPNTISYGDVMKILVIVFDTDDNTIRDAKVRIEIDSSDGYFLGTETSLIVGRTDENGKFKSKWKCLEREYGGRIREIFIQARKKGYLGRTKEFDFKTYNKRK